MLLCNSFKVIICNQSKCCPKMYTVHVCAKSVHSCLWCVLVIPWTIACQAPLSMGFSRQEYWSGLPCPPPGSLPNPGISPHLLSFLQSRQMSHLKPKFWKPLHFGSTDTPFFFLISCCFYLFWSNFDRWLEIRYFSVSISDPQMPMSTYNL